MNAKIVAGLVLLISAAALVSTIAFFKNEEYKAEQTRKSTIQVIENNASLHGNITYFKPENIDYTVDGGRFKVSVIVYSGNVRTELFYNVNVSSSSVEIRKRKVSGRYLDGSKIYESTKWDDMQLSGNLTLKRD